MMVMVEHDAYPVLSTQCHVMVFCWIECSAQCQTPASNDRCAQGSCSLLLVCALPVKHPSIYFTCTHWYAKQCHTKESHYRIIRKRSVGLSDLNIFVSLDCKVAVDSTHAHPKTSMYDIRNIYSTQVQYTTR